MSFLAECLFCNHQAQVPDRALGASGRCPKCRNWYTLVPTPNPPRATSPPHRPAPAGALACGSRSGGGALPQRFRHENRR